MDQADFPWRSLGALLVEDDLLAAGDLERALVEQRQTGRLLGQILVDQGQVSAVALARALARQHGVELRALSSLEPDGLPALSFTAPSPNPERSWRPLGRLLVQQGVLADTDLHEALAEQLRRPERRLGEILLERGLVTGAMLASALALQHGIELETQNEDVEAVAVPVVQGQPTYQVCSVAYEQTGERRTILYQGPSLLDAADFACEYVDREQPVAVEIERREGSERETVWTYSRDRAEAAASSSKSLVETFGFDPTRWNPAPRVDA